MRTIPAGILTALGQDVVEPWYAVNLDFDGGPLRLWTGYGSRTIEGRTYLGVGTIMSISGLEEVADLSARQVTVEFNGIDGGVVALALQEPYQRRRARILFGVAGQSDAIEIWAGQINTISTLHDGQRAQVTVTLESRLVELERAKTRLYTDESHQAYAPGDSFFSYVSGLVDREIIWGRATPGETTVDPPSPPSFPDGRDPYNRK
jgi:hypothetical protein